MSLSIIFLRKPVPKMVLYIFPSELFIVFPGCFPIRAPVSEKLQLPWVS